MDRDAVPALVTTLVLTALLAALVLLLRLPSKMLLVTLVSGLWFAYLLASSLRPWRRRG